MYTATTFRSWDEQPQDGVQRHRTTIIEKQFRVTVCKALIQIFFLELLFESFECTSILVIIGGGHHLPKWGSGKKVPLMASGTSYV